MRLSNEIFLATLGELYGSTEASGTVYVTFKHHDGESPCCLVRAASSKQKISTLVRGGLRASCARGVLTRSRPVHLRR